MSEDEIEEISKNEKSEERIVDGVWEGGVYMMEHWSVTYLRYKAH